MKKPWECPICDKRFTTKHGTAHHMQDKHDATGYFPVRRQPPISDDYEPSLADIAVEAELKRNMGEPLDPLEESLIFDD